MCYYWGQGINQDYSQAVHWYKAAAEKGNAQAMHELGFCYSYGKGVNEDPSQAFHWYKKGAENGNASAMNELGNCYKFGRSVNVDNTQAVYWYKKAAEMGNGMAMGNLGDCYKQGWGLTQDYHQAFYWYKKGAEMGNYFSIYNLSNCYKYGEGVKKNKSKSKILYNAYKTYMEHDVAGARNLLYQVFPEMAKRDEPEKTAGLEKAAEPEKTAEPVKDEVPVNNVPVMAASDVDVNIPCTGKRNENTFAVIIANENYRRESKVPFAHNDGKVMKEYCIKTLGMPEKNIHLVTDATLNDIRAEVDWMRQVAEVFKGDAQIIFFYAGHGVPNEKTHDAYLLPADGSGKNLITAYSLEDLYRNMSQCSTRNTLVFLDACFSGKQRSGQDMTSARAVGISVKNTVPKGNMVVFSAAEGDQTAFPYKEKKHGMFTYFLLKKLQQEKGNVNLGDLSSYIKEKVQRTSVIDGKRQTPTVQPSSSMTDRWKDIRL